MALSGSLRTIMIRNVAPNFLKVSPASPYFLLLVVAVLSPLSIRSWNSGRKGILTSVIFSNPL